MGKNVSTTYSEEDTLRLQNLTHYVRRLTFFGVAALVIASGILSLPQAYASAGTRTKVGSFTVPASTGHHSVTGVGFQPKAVLFFSVRRTADGTSSNNGQNLDMATTILGMATSSSARGAIYSTDDFSCGNPDHTNDGVIHNRACRSGINTTYYTADFVSMDGDGFTVDFSTVDTTPYVVNYMALGGDGLSATITDFTTPAVAGDLVHTGVGFRPDALIMIGGSSASQSRGMGFVSGVDSQVANSSTYGCCGNAAAARYQRTDKAYIEIDGVNKINEATLTSFNDGGFTLDFTETNAGATSISALSLRGAQFKTGSITQRTSAGTQSTTGVGFQPVGLLMSTVLNTASSSIETTDIVQSFGASDGTSQANTTVADNLNGNASLDRTKIYTSIADDAVPTVQAAAALTSFDTDGFTLNYTSADTTPREIIYFAIGGASVVPQSGFPITNYSAVSRTDITQSVTVSPGNNSILIVRSSHENASDSGGITGITFNGDAFTKLDSEHASTWSRAEIWYLLNPDATTANLVATKNTAGSDRWGISIDAYDNVDQATPWGATVSKSAADAGLSDSLTAGDFSPGDRTIDILSLDYTGHNAVAGAHMTSSFGMLDLGAMSNEGQAADNTTDGVMSWTWTLDYPFTHIAAVLKANVAPTNTSPPAPSLESPGDNAVGVSTTPRFQLKTSDTENDYLRYKIDVCANADCSTIIRTIDQTSSQTGWSGQDAAINTAYSGASNIGSSTTATHTYQSPALNPNTQYWWRAYAVDPDGNNIFSAASAIRTFTTFNFPTTGLIDNFNRSNNTTISGETSSSGHSWAMDGILHATPTGLRIASNQLRYGGDGADAYVATLFGPDSEVYIDMPTLPANGRYVALWSRIQDPGSPLYDSYALVYIHNTSGNATWSLRRYDNSGSNVLTNISAPAIATGDSIGLSVTGTGSSVSVAAFHKNAGTWSMVGRVNDSSPNRITSAGYIGIESDAGDPPQRIDNMSGGTVIVGAVPNSPSNLGAPSYVDGSLGSDAAPSFSFDLSDPDNSQDIRYRIQIDDTSNFSSPLTDFTSALGPQGSQNFTVGQAASGGSYAAGTSGQTLSDGNYYWRVSAIDADSNISAYTTANGGSVAFSVDTTAPSINSLSPADNASGVGLTDNLVISFSESIRTATGSLTIKRSTDNSTLQAINIAGGQVTGSGTATLTINPSVNFVSNTGYYIEISSGAITDDASNAFAGIANATSWNFTSASLSNPILSSPSTGSVHNSIPTSFTIAEAPLNGSLQLIFAGGSTITLTLDNLGIGSHSFNLNPASLFSSSEVASADASSIPDDIYDITLSMRDTNNTTTLTNLVSNVMIDKTAPTVPGVPVSVSPSTDTTPTWNWSGSSDSTSGVSHYILQRSQDSGFAGGITSHSSNTTSFTIPSALTVGNWYFRVRAVDLAGNMSAYAPTVLFSVTAAPNPPVSEAPATNNPAQPTRRPSATPAPSTATEAPTSTPIPVIEKQKISLDNYPDFTSGKGKQLALDTSETVSFTLQGRIYDAVVTQVNTGSVVISIGSDTRSLSIDTKTTVKHDTDRDGTDDIAVTLVGVEDGKAVLKFAKIQVTPVSSELNDTGDFRVILIVVAGAFTAVLLYLLFRKSRE